MKKLITTTLVCACCALIVNAQQHKLWYDKPATQWLEALPIGNSQLGAMVYGGIETEEIQLNEETFWSGSPHSNNSPEAKAHLQEVRQLIFQGKEKEAHELIEKYFIKGWVVGFNRGASFDSDFPKYGNDFVYLSARQDGKGTKQFYAYRLLGKFGAKFPDLECVQVGDFMVISCYPMNYNGIYESSGACFAYSSGNAHFNEIFPAFPGCPEPGEGEISVTEAEKIALELASKQTSTETYKIRGVVTSVDAADFNPSYGNLTFNISDGMSYATCFRLKGKNNAKFTSADQVQVGDTVLVNAKIQNYNGTCEPTSGYVEESTNPNF